MEEIIKEIEKIVGNEWIIKEKEKMLNYIFDETPLPIRPKPSNNIVLVKPKSTEEISQILKLANKEKIPVYPRGGGTGLVGGCVPTKDGIILSFERMDNIEIDKDNLMAIAEAGATLGKLLSISESFGLFFPPHPGDEGAQIGGLIACNAAGARTVKYGPMRNFVKGIEVVLPNGEILKIGGKLLKNNFGYDLMDLIIGSEGTLAIVTKAIIRLYPPPKAILTLIVPYENRHDSINSVPKILQEGIIPLAIEYVEKDVIEISAKHINKKWPIEEGIAYLIIIVDGLSEEEVYGECERIVEICKSFNSLEPIVATSKEEQKNILDIRSNIYTALKPNTADILDVTVPPSSIGKLMDIVDNIEKKYSTYLPTFGHAADGNLHVHIMMDKINEMENIRNEIYIATIKLGGTITGEHGIGEARIKYINNFMDKKQYEIMLKIKKIFDPNNILNPGKKLSF